MTRPPLRPFQLETLQALREAPHVICVAPTGSGKTRIIEELLDAGERVLLFTPLAALARQQQALLAGRAATVVNPESRKIGRILAELRPTLVAVDECHCYVEWGREFRPAFRKIPRVIGRKSLWLTATLPRAMEREIRRALPAGETRTLGRFRLPESLHLRVTRVDWPRRPARLQGLLSVHREPGIVFTRTREGAERVARLVSAMGRRAFPYHAGFAREERLRVERIAAVGGDCIVIATCAFGMGLHLPRFRWVAFWEAPSSLLALAQLAGRVGRVPGERAHVTVLWDENDFRPGEADSSELRDFLRAERGCREELISARFAEREPAPAARCGRCDNCDHDAMRLSYC